VDNFPARKDERGREPAPEDVEKFARMLEKSSLGSEESRRARLDGARALAEHSTAGCPWVAHAPFWTDIAMLHQNMADLFEAKGDSEQSELWLRAALNRTVDGPRATRLATLLEQRRAMSEAVVWYERATEIGDPVASARLAVLCHLFGSGQTASLLLSLGRSRMSTGRLAEADRLAGDLAKTGRRHRDQLIAGCRDEDLLYWVGCLLLASGSRKVAAECYSAAMVKGHAAAALSLYDLQMSPASNEEGVSGDAREQQERRQPQQQHGTGNLGGHAAAVGRVFRDAKRVAQLRELDRSAPQWRLAEYELTSVAYRTLHKLLRNGDYVARTARLNRSVRLSDAEWRVISGPDGELSDFVHEMLVKGLTRFYKSIKEDIWQPDRNTSLQTYFVNCCLLNLSTIVRDWRASRRRHDAMPRSLS